MEKLSDTITSDFLLTLLTNIHSDRKLGSLPVTVKFTKEIGLLLPKEYFLNYAFYECYGCYVHKWVCTQECVNVSRLEYLYERYVRTTY